MSSLLSSSSSSIFCLSTSSSVDPSSTAFRASSKSFIRVNIFFCVHRQNRVYHRHLLHCILDEPCQRTSCFARSSSLTSSLKVNCLTCFSRAAFSSSNVSLNFASLPLAPLKKVKWYIICTHTKAKEY